MAHTPGPWTYSRPASPYWGDDNEWGMVGPVVAFGHIDNECVYCSEDDARLIVAAPDLLEALKAVVFEFEGWIDWQRKDVLKKAFAAIAKAEGK